MENISSEHNKRALLIIENYCGRSFSESEHTERIKLINRYGRLTHDPVEVKSVQLRSKAWQFASVFGASDWIDVNPSNIFIEGKQVYVEGSLLHAQYDEMFITYTTGRITFAVSVAMDLLIKQIEKVGFKSVYHSASLITPEIAELLSPYKVTNGVN